MTKSEKIFLMLFFIIFVGICVLCPNILNEMLYVIKENSFSFGNTLTDTVLSFIQM